MTMSRSGLADTSDMLPHSEAKPARLAVAGTRAAVAVEGGVAVLDDTDVDGVDTHKLTPQPVVLGPVGTVPLTVDPDLFCPHPATPRAPRAMTAMTRAE